MKYKPAFVDDAAVNRALAELKGDRRFNAFVDTLWALRETALSRLFHDDIVADSRVSLAYQIEARVYQDILNRIEDAGIAIESQDEA